MKKLSTLLVFLLIGFCISLQAQLIDPQFGDAGIYQHKLGRAGSTISIIKPFRSNKILLGGFVEQDPIYSTSNLELRNRFWLGCYDWAGKPVEDFGKHGEIILEDTTAWRIVPMVHIGRNNKIIIAGYDNSGLVLERLRSDGQPDSSFAEDGILSLSISHPGKLSLQKFLLKEDGKILILAHFNSGYEGIALIQLLQNGTLDPDFGDAGISIIDGEILFQEPPSINLIHLREMLILSDKRILLSGHQTYLGFKGLILILNEQGKVDSTSQLIISPISLREISNTLQLPDGDLLVAGISLLNGRYQVSKISLEGKLDEQFGHDGHLPIPAEVLSLPVTPHLMRVYGQQKIHMIFSRDYQWFLTNPTISQFCQYDLYGRLDVSFADSGFRAYDVIPEAPRLIDFCYLPDGRIASLGGAKSGTHWGIWHADGKEDPGFTSSGYLPVPTLDGGVVPFKMVLNAEGSIASIGHASFKNEHRNSIVYHKQMFFHLANPAGERAASATSYHAYSTFHDMMTISNQRILLAGSSNLDPKIIAVLPDGRLDKTFGEKGEAPLGVPTYDIYGYAKHLDTLANGNIVVAGKFPKPGFMRYLPNGMPDRSLNGTGIAMAPTNFNNRIHISAAHFYDDGRLLLALKDNTTHHIIRLNAQGEMDNSFGTQGMVQYKDSIHYRNIIRDKSGNFTLGGHLDGMFKLAYFDAKGNRRRSFGEEGIITIIFPEGKATTYDLKQLPTGNIIMAGEVVDTLTAQRSWAMAVYQPDGKPDSSFGNAGLLVMSYSDFDASAHTIAIAKDSSFYIGGVIDGRFSIIHFISKIIISNPEIDPIIEPVISVIWDSVVVYPNPIKSQASLGYHVASEQKIRLNLVNIAGKHIFHFFDKKRLPGSYTEELIFPKGLQAGWYLLILEAQNGRKVIKILVQ